LPNVGKSTLFNALVKNHQAEASNYAFCTIDPNVGIVDVPDERLSQLAKIANPKKIIPATVEFIDIAGIVKEAHKGEGLGNKFLSHIRECDAICMVLRCFIDENIMHVAGKIDPKEDMETIVTELELADLETKEKINVKNQKSNVKMSDQNVKFLSDKPIIYALNVSESDAGLSVEDIIKKFSLPDLLSKHNSIVISAKVEEDLIDLNLDEQKEYLESLGLANSGLDRLIKSAYDTLGLQSYFTAGTDEVRAWTINKGDKAPRAASKIHTDFERGFIKAEVISYNDYIELNGEIGAKTAGKLRQEGKDYIVCDGDVIEFKFNV